MAITVPTFDLATTGTDPKLTTSEELKDTVEGMFVAVSDQLGNLAEVVS